MSISRARAKDLLIFLGLKRVGSELSLDHVIPGKFQDKSADFYLQEYEYMRREVEIVIKFARELERNVVVAVGISWAWLFRERQNIPGWSWLFPCLFVILGVMRAYGNTVYFRAVNNYLTMVERTIVGDSAPRGWHRYTERNWTRLSVLGFWSLLFISTVAVALWELFTRR